MSSKTARLRRRQARRRKRDKRLRKSGRVPQHTPAERRQEKAERLRKQEAEQSRQAWRRRVVIPVLIPTAAAGVMFLPLAQASSGHNSSLYLWTAHLADSGSPDLPHVPEQDRTLYTSSNTRGTATTFGIAGPPGPASWDAWGWSVPD